MTKKELRKKTRQLIQDSAQWMRRDIERVLLSGAVDYANAENNYVLPKTIMLALLKEQMRNYDGKGTSYEKQIKKDAENIYARL